MTAGISIKNEKVVRDIRELARWKQVGLTEAVELAVSGMLDRRMETREKLQADFDAFFEWRKSQPISNITSDHRDLYDENGM
ncbi:MAG: type II toxin-antitoxin system VapB family antitoxin [Ahrensia sp.]|nr:type II toxin-antitoxin system VapB family antitoxin [Ahrensia sp.]